MARPSKTMMRSMANGRLSAQISPEKELWRCERCCRLQQGSHSGCPDCGAPRYLEPVTERRVLTDNEMAAMEIGVKMKRTLRVVG